MMAKKVLKIVEWNGENRCNGAGKQSSTAVVNNTSSNKP